MTSASSSRPLGNMPPPNRTSRLLGYTSNDGTEQTSQNGATSQHVNGASKTIWTARSLNSRDTTQHNGSATARRGERSPPRGLGLTSGIDSDETSPTHPSGSHGMPSIWAPSAVSWGHSGSIPNQNTSRTASPNRTRDAPRMSELPSGSFFPTARSGPFNSHTQSASQDFTTNAFGSFPSARQDEMSTAAGQFKTPSYDNGQSTRTGRPAHRSSQDTSLANLLQSINPREHSMPPPGFQNGSAAFSGGFTSSQSRPSVQASNSFPMLPTHTGGYNPNSQPDPADITKRLRALNVNGDRESSSSSQLLFNPLSQPWHSNGTRGPNSRQSTDDTYGDTQPALQSRSQRGSIAERIPTPQSASNQFSSPRSFVASAVAPDPWSRPGSRDHRFAPLDRRNPLGFVIPPTQQGGYPPQLYDGSAVRLPGYDSPLGQYPQFGSPFAPYNAHIPMYPPTNMYSNPNRGPVQDARSNLLVAFRQDGRANKRYELRDIYGHIVEFAGDQHGSRFIQQKLESANSDDKDNVFAELKPNIIPLMKDVFGNYVIQKFFEHGDQVQKKALAGMMMGKVADLSTQMYACRVVQKALEYVLAEQQAELVKEMEPDVVRIIKDQNGNHVIQKIIELVPQENTRFIMDAIKGQVRELAHHNYGCRVVQRMMEYGTDADKATITAELHAAASHLVNCQFGNYVIQHIIEKGLPDDQAKMLEYVTSHVLEVSKHKYASNVVEKCIHYASNEQRHRICEAFMSKGTDGTPVLPGMMLDQYGNYVLQKLLKTVQGSDLTALVEAIKPHMATVKKSSSHRQIPALEKLLIQIEDDAAKQATRPAPSSPPQLEVSSPAPTPASTNEPNTPQSSQACADMSLPAGKINEVDLITAAKIAV